MAQPRYQLELNRGLPGSVHTPLSDITPLCDQMLGQYRANRPILWSFQVPCDQPEVNTIDADGRPYLCKGRTLKVRRTSSTGSTSCVANNIILRVQRKGGVNGAVATVTSASPWVWWGSRPVRDETGNFSTPNYLSPIAGAEILQRAVRNSIIYEGTLGLDPDSGDFDTTVPPAVDLGVELTNWPITIGDLASLLVATGALDILIDPLDSGAGDIMGRLNAVNKAGVDHPGVHLDYGTGNNAIKEIDHSDDLATITNKLYLYFGPKQHDNPLRFRGLITADDSELPDPPQTAINALIAASRALYGIWMDTQFYDAEDHTGARKLFEALWQTEVLLRSQGRELLTITPHSDRGSPFLPFEDYYLHDTIRVNASAAKLGVAIAGAQRIYGFDVKPSRDGVEEMGELIASADAE
jgi:hypothetical protein